MSLKISLSTFRALNAHLPNIRCNIGLKTICNEVYCIYNIGVKTICNEINCIHSSEKTFPYLISNMESGSSKIVSDVWVFVMSSYEILSLKKLQELFLINYDILNENRFCILLWTNYNLNEQINLHIWYNASDSLKLSSPVFLYLLAFAQNIITV